MNKKFLNFTERILIGVFVIAITIVVILNILSANSPSEIQNATRNQNQENVIDTISPHLDKNEKIEIDTTEIKTVPALSDSLEVKSPTHEYITGKWRSNNFTIDFFENGSFLILVEEGKESKTGLWKIDNEQLLIKYLGETMFTPYTIFEMNENYIIFGYDSKKFKFYKIN